MPDAYTPQQTTFLLSILSNLASQQKGTPDDIERYLAGRIDAHLETSKPGIGVWTRVWGPAVYQAPGSSVADNVMYVARNDAAPPRLVVAIAGTNPASALDVLVEDFFVGTQVPWFYGSSGPGAAPKISAGTFVGLSVLQHLRPGPAMPGAGQTLSPFLAATTADKPTIVTAGHSLGGALAPAVALWLHDTQSAWNAGGLATVGCEPSAGPTPGDAAFAAYYDTQLGARTTRLFNDIDIVPHAWNEVDLAAIPALYAPALPSDALVAALAALAGELALDGDYAQLAPSAPALAGTVNTAIIDPSRPVFENFLAQALYQHTEEYFTLMKVSWTPELMTAMRAVAGTDIVARLSARYRTALARHGASATIG